MVRRLVFCLSDPSLNLVQVMFCCCFFFFKNINIAAIFIARLHEVHRAIAVTQVVHVPVTVPVRVRVTLAFKFSRSPYLDNHSSESIHT